MQLRKKLHFLSSLFMQVSFFPKNINDKWKHLGKQKVLFGQQNRCISNSNKRFICLALIVKKPQ